MAPKKMVVLFDESGTPAISNDPRTDWFLGVGVVYEQSDEEFIFSKGEAVFGLAKTKPLKNNQISNSHAVRIAELLADLPVSIYVSSLDTANPILHQIIADYECYSNEARLKVRGIRGRPIAQIIYFHVRDHCIFNTIVGHFEARGGDAAFAVFTDDWSIPENDIEIALDHSATSLCKTISQHVARLSEARLDSIAPFELLTKDNSRKRFVDVVASIFSRAYLRTNDEKYSREAADILQECRRAHCTDATQHSIDLMQEVMKQGPREG